ncbi:hypothetical protein QQ045_025363 [Rhodiola kirilowii]
MAIKQKIVLQVDVMHCGKCRMKAMEIVAGTEGVMSIATEGEDRNQLVLVGVGIDSATLTTSLRKKVGYTSIISIEKQKIVLQIDLPCDCDKYRTKAKKIAACAKGVMSMSIEGADLNQVVVVGEGIDSATLAITLRKKVGDTRIISVTEVKSADAIKKEEEAKKKAEEAKKKAEEEKKKKEADDKKKKEEEEEEAKNKIIPWGHFYHYSYAPYPPPGYDMVCYGKANSWPFTW